MKFFKSLVLAAVGALLILAGFAFAQFKNVSTPTAHAATKIASDTQPVLRGAPSFADIAQRVNPAVVSITAIVIQKNRQPNNHGNFPGPMNPFQFFFGTPHPQMPRGTPPVQESGGSGFIISPNGYILTNNHVVKGASKVTVRLDDDRSFTAKIVGTDADTDIALLKINAENLPTLPMGNSDAIRQGDWVMAVGNPLMYSHTVTVGVISAKGRHLSSNSLDNFLQTDAAINFGNSGGPLVDTSGKAIGINTAITRSDFRGRMVEGIGFAIPINIVKEELPQLKSGHPVKRGYMGVRVGPVDHDAIAYYKSTFGIKINGGALIQSVDEGTPAAKAHLEKGDIIVSVDGKKIKDSSELPGIVSAYAPGKTIKLGIIRKGHRKSIKITLGDRAVALNGGFSTKGGKKGKHSAKNVLGIMVQEITPQARMMYRIPQALNGVVITSVDPKSSAFSKGIREGMVLNELDGKTINSVEDFQSAVAKVKKGDMVSVYLPSAHGGIYMYFPAD